MATSRARDDEHLQSSLGSNKDDSSYNNRVAALSVSVDDQPAFHLVTTRKQL